MWGQTQAQQVEEGASPGLPHTRVNPFKTGELADQMVITSAFQVGEIPPERAPGGRELCNSENLLLHGWGRRAAQADTGMTVTCC